MSVGVIWLIFRLRRVDLLGDGLYRVLVVWALLECCRVLLMRAVFPGSTAGWAQLQGEGWAEYGFC